MPSLINSNGYLIGTGSDNSIDILEFSLFDTEGTQIYNSISQENVNVGEIDYLDNSNIGEINNIISYNFEVTYLREFSDSVNPCEDYVPPNSSPPVYTPPPVPPPIYYYFSGQNPNTKIFETWRSVDPNSKSPQWNPNVIYKFVAQILEDEKAL